MKKRIGWIAVISAIGIILLITSAYVGLSLYYSNTYSFGTWINGVYCTGKSINEVNDILRAQCSYEGLDIISEKDGINIHISADECGYDYDYSDALAEYKREQKPWKWPISFLSKRNTNIVPRVIIDDSKLSAALDKYEIMNEAAPSKVAITRDANGYNLLDTSKHRADNLRVRDAVRTGLVQGLNKIDLDTEESFFFDESYSKEQLEVIDYYNLITSQLDFEIVYMMGEDREVIDTNVLDGFLLKDENGELISSVSVDISQDDEAQNRDPFLWDDEAICSWVDLLADKYDTLGKKRQFKATGGYDIEIGGGIYGNVLNREAEKKYLLDAVHNHLGGEHEPEYSQKAFKQGLDDIGTTYIEVNMTEQKLYYYVDGTLTIEAPVVTGNMRLRRETPSGVNYVYFMQRNRTLHGADYATFVKYWIAVKGAIGIHDASWRKEFGEDIYLTDGSHGCINTPDEQVSKLYDMVEIGTPVVMFYMD